MAWAATYKVVLGTFAFLMFWTLATFPAVRFMPIGRTAGALLGGTLMVVFQVLSPSEAFAAIDLPILGLLFGTMVVSVYLERADLFKYLKRVLGWKCRGAKDLLVRVSVFSGLASAVFTNDTICVIFTEFVLNMCKQKGLPPEPFLLALASCANIGSATTPIGNPQNLVIAIESKIPFGKFLLGVLPAMVAGIIFNILFLLALYWKPLTASNTAPAPTEEGDDSASVEMENVKEQQPAPPLLPSKINAGAAGDHHYASPGRKSPLSYERLRTDSKIMHHQQPEDAAPEERPTQLYSSRVYSPVHPVADKQRPLYSPRVHSPHHHLGHSPSPSPSPLSPAVTAARFYSNSHARHNHPGAHNDSTMVEINEPAAPAAAAHRPPLREHLHKSQQLTPGSEPSWQEPEKHIVTIDGGAKQEEEESWWRWGPKMRRRAWMAAVYGVTAGFLAALLSGLNLTWSALTAAVALMVLDFSDAGPSLDRVSYSLLVFFSGMFITVDGFNRTGAPGQFWNSVEPHTRIDTPKGIAILSLVILVLSNVASNVPTVLLLGVRVAASAAATHGASVTKAWLYLAWVSTVAGNFTLIGSAANLIVCEQARQAKPNSYNLTFWAHLKFGIPSTLIVTALGLPFIRG